MIKGGVSLELVMRDMGMAAEVEGPYFPNEIEPHVSVSFVYGCTYITVSPISL